MSSLINSQNELDNCSCNAIVKEMQFIHDNSINKK